MRLAHGRYRFKIRTLTDMGAGRAAFTRVVRAR